MQRISDAIHFCGLLFLLAYPNVGKCQPPGLDADGVFKSQVRTTEPLSPQAEAVALKVPAGFRVTLFASEPQIQKPLNMAFDADGRLWVTGSNEYPMPAESGQGRDTIRILEDTTGDGTADKVTTFADDLNIPIGLYPWKDGVIVFSIPNILFLRDTDGDGQADQREVLYGPFDTTRDTHGMNNAFRRGFDGWLYCCHGFNNQSQVAGADGHTITMHSGNTYRIRLDGSRIEHFTHGQVNPFGMTIDAYGDLFNSDCHTKPVSLLIRGGHYNSFGKPHDGLGYVPDVMNHLHGSTAIDALCQYQATSFPDEYHDDLFVGNVMTCRIHRNSIVRNGGSIAMQEEADFLISEDPWFRPVDMQVGPDGALYVADFYNRIIGHYEVPLDHPGRDRSRGRIWRIDWGGLPGEPSPSPPETLALSSANSEKLIATLRDERKGVRQHAADQIVDRIGVTAADQLTSALKQVLLSADQTAAPQLLWCLQRLGQISPEQLFEVYTNANEQTRVHIMRICSERVDTDALTGLIRRGLREAQPCVVRSAADAASQHVSVAQAKEIINATVVASKSDMHLRHALKIALRNQFQSLDVVEWFTSGPAPTAAIAAVSDVLPGLKGSYAAEVGLFLLQSEGLEKSRVTEVVKVTTAAATDEQILRLMKIMNRWSASDIRANAENWESINAALQSRPGHPPEQFLRWSAAVAEQIFQTVNIDELGWGQYSLSGEPIANWGVEERRSDDDATTPTPFLSSLPGGERGVGVVRSRPFVLPFQMRVQICGHLGPPAESPTPNNRLVLRDADSGQEIRSELAPRNDVASTIDWKLSGYAGRKAYFEVIDGIDRNAYAWLAIGRPTPAVVKPEEFDNGHASALLSTAIKIILRQQSVGQRMTDSQVRQMKQLVELVQVGGMLRSLAAKSLLMHFDQAAVLPVAELLQMATTPHDIERVIVGYCQGPRDETEGYSLKSQQDLVEGIFQRVNSTLRHKLVNDLAGSSDGVELLMAALEKGTPSAEVLRDDRLVERLMAFGREVAVRVQELKAGLPAVEQSHQKLSESIIRRLRLGSGDSASGEAVFRKHCIVCHRRAGEGGQAGPQLDGIATRGAARLLEDILQPNQNVDVNFRTSSLVLNDGRVLSGIVRKPDPLSALLVVIGTDGKLTGVAGDDVAERVDSRLSLMPANVSTLLSEDELLNLVTWLMK